VDCRIGRVGRVALVVLPLIGCELGAGQSCETRATAPSGPGGQGQLWPNEPAGLTPMSDGPFNPSERDRWKGEGSGRSLATDSTAPLSSCALVFTYPVGFQSGGAPGVEFLSLPAPTKEAFVGLWWKPSDSWQTHPSGVNKIAFLFPATSSVGSTYIMMFHDGTQYTIQTETTFLNDTRRFEPTAVATPVVLGKWHRIEWYVKYSTTRASRDGVTRWWLDGVLQGEYKDLQMPGDAGFIEFTIRPVWGGAEGNFKAQTDSYRYGPIHISGALPR
jgi:hypothetical protein